MVAATASATVSITPMAELLSTGRAYRLSRRGIFVRFIVGSYHRVSARSFSRSSMNLSGNANFGKSLASMLALLAKFGIP